MAARAQGTAAISFGLVSIPIKLYTTAQSSSAIRFNHLDPNGARVKQQYISSKTGEVVPRDQMIKGYEFAKGQYVTFEPDELKALEAKSTYTIDIKEFVPLDEVTREVVQKSYYLGPDKGGAKAYHLLSEAMQETGRVAIAKYAARGKDYLVMIRPHQDGLAMEQLYYADEVKSFDEVPVDDAEVGPEEIKLAVQLIDQASSDHFEHAKYEDEVRSEILAMIEKKVAGEEITVEAEDESETKIIDLMDALKASIKDTGKKPAKQVGKKKAAKKKATRKSASK
ncbi:MAG: Ku protein [Xanthomonadales bacterium]|nr:Ku protein [Xanthomonadales bacterium]